MMGCMGRERLAYLMAGLMLVALGSVYLLHDASRFYLHFALIQLSHGVSMGKVLFLIGFCLLVCVWLAWAAGRDTARARNPRWPVIVWIGSSVIGLGAALASHLVFIREHGLPIHQHVWTWRDGLNSATSFTHTHTSKAPIAVALEWFGMPEMHRRFDTGFAFVDSVPAWLATLNGLSFLITFVSVIGLAPRVVMRYPIGQRWAVAVVYALAGGSLAKCLLDGGPLAYDAVAGAVAVVLLFATDRLEQMGRVLRRGIIPLALTLGVWVGVVVVCDFGVTGSLIKQLVYRLSIYGLVLSLAAVLSSRQSGRMSLATCGVCAVLVLLGLGSGVRHTLMPLMGTAPEVAIRYPIDEPALPHRVPSGTRVKDAYALLADDAYRTRHTSVGLDRRAPTGLILQITPLEGETLDLSRADSDVIRFKKTRVTQERGRLRIWLEVSFDAELGPVVYTEQRLGQLHENERFVAYHLIDRALRQAGLSRYHLITYAAYRDETSAM